jgi:hypothetical protein
MNPKEWNYAEIIAAIAAMASAFSAWQLNELEKTKREFELRSNAAAAVQTWQTNVSEHAKNGIKCIAFLTDLATDTANFKKAAEKEPYTVEGSGRVALLKECLDESTQSQVDVANNNADGAKNKTPIVIPIHASKYIATQAFDYLNFTEAVFMQRKYKTASECIVADQLGKDASNNLRALVATQTGEYAGLSEFFSNYKDTDAVLKFIYTCPESKKPD